jgi:hypothetical protein
MTRKQLQSLISAGVFSAALLSGIAYADDAPATTNANAPAPAASGTGTGTDQPATPSATDQSAQTNQDKSAAQDSKQAVSTSKGAAQHGCAGAGGCSSDSK